MTYLHCPRCHQGLLHAELSYRCQTVNCGFRIWKLGIGPKLIPQGVIFKRSNVKTIDIWQMEELDCPGGALGNFSMKMRSRHNQDTP